VKTKVKDAEAKRKLSACEYGVKDAEPNRVKIRDVKFGKNPQIFFSPHSRKLRISKRFLLSK